MKRMSIILIPAGVVLGDGKNAVATWLQQLYTLGAFLGPSTASFSAGFGPHAGIVLQKKWNAIVRVDIHGPARSRFRQPHLRRDYLAHRVDSALHGGNSTEHFECCAPGKHAHHGFKSR